MSMLRPVARLATLAGLVLSSLAPVAPVAAAPADVALLKSYVGEWRGSGQLTGSNSERVSCKLSLTSGNADKVNYSGRCALAGNNLSVKGTLAYVDANRRYEAVMTSNVTFSGVAIGQKSGDGIVFNLKERTTDKDSSYDINAVIALRGGRINIEFTFRDVKSGQGASASVPFTKS